MIGVLNAYHFDTSPESYQATYEPMALAYFKKVMPNQSFKTYLVAQNQFPNDIQECSGWIITGSPASAYEKKPWIENLIQFIIHCHTEKRKLLGICFGHQIIAQALGGQTLLSDKGWGIGVQKFKIIQSKVWMRPPLESDGSLLFSHQDQVTHLPDGSELLATNDFCPFQMYCIGEHIFSMQGHPEFTKNYALSRYESRKSKLGEDLFKAGIESLQKETQEKIIGQWINNFFDPKPS